MKKLFVLLLALSLVFALAACGDKPEGDKPESGRISIPPPSGSQSQSENPGGQDSTPAPDVDIGNSVEAIGNKVIHKMNDGLGTVAKYEYIYQGGVLSEVKLTLTCGNRAAAETAYDQLKSGEKEGGIDTTDKSFRLDGNKIHCKMTEDYVAAFAVASQEELADLLGGGDPYAGGTGGGAAVGETTINTAWSDLSLPDGFPKLADGVTEYTQISENNFSISWDAMSEADAGAMAEKLETWTGGTLGLMEDSGVKNWFLDTGKHTVTLTYYADTFGGTMSQLLLNVSIWE